MTRIEVGGISFDGRDTLLMIGLVIIGPSKIRIYSRRTSAQWMTNGADGVVEHDSMDDTKERVFPVLDAVNDVGMTAEIRQKDSFLVLMNDDLVVIQGGINNPSMRGMGDMGIISDE